MSLEKSDSAFQQPLITYMYKQHPSKSGEDMERLTLVLIKVFDQNNMSETERSRVFPSSALEKHSIFCPDKALIFAAFFILL